MDEFMTDAIAQAKQGLGEGGIPIGSVLVKTGKLSVEDTTSASKIATPLPTPKLIAYATLAESAITRIQHFILR
jgi:hypothetical protein